MLKDRLYRIGLVLAVLTTGMMALAESPLLWGASRYLAGLSTAAGLMLGSGLILNWLLRHGHRAELGLHFSGLGLGIVVGALLVELAAPLLDWRGQWWLLTAGALLLVPAWRWLPRPNSGSAAGAASRRPGRAGAAVALAAAGGLSLRRVRLRHQCHLYRAHHRAAAGAGGAGRPDVAAGGARRGAGADPLGPGRAPPGLSARPGRSPTRCRSSASCCRC
jgi:MFS family permease